MAALFHFSAPLRGTERHDAGPPVGGRGKPQRVAVRNEGRDSGARRKVDDLAKEVMRIKTGVVIFKWIIAPVIGILSLALALVSIGSMVYRIMSDG